MRKNLLLSLLLLCLAAGAALAADPAPVPRLIDFGADKCDNCKKMKPVLKQLRTDYEGIVTVDFIDVWKDTDAGKPYKIRLIPTQIFLDAAGKEVFRHEGFFSREDIEKVFQEKLGLAPVKAKAD
jgi:thioredoxin 1